MDTHASSWTDRPDARALLESCAKRPPFRDHFTQFFGLTSDRWTAFAGPRARDLEGIRERHLCELSGADWDAADPDAAACQHYLDLDKSQASVTAAIEGAIGDRPIRTRDFDVGLVGRPVQV